MKKKSDNCVPPRIISRKEDSEFVLSRSEAAQMLDNEKGYPTEQSPRSIGLTSDGQK